MITQSFHNLSSMVRTKDLYKIEPGICISSSQGSVYIFPISRWRNKNNGFKLNKIGLFMYTDVGSFVFGYNVSFMGPSYIKF